MADLKGKRRELLLHYSELSLFPKFILLHCSPNPDPSLVVMILETRKPKLEKKKKRRPRCLEINDMCQEKNNSEQLCFWPWHLWQRISWNEIPEILLARDHGISRLWSLNGQDHLRDGAQTFDFEKVGMVISWSFLARELWKIWRSRTANNFFWNMASNLILEVIGGNADKRWSLLSQEFCKYT